MRILSATRPAIFVLLAFVLCTILSCEKDNREPDAYRSSGLQVNIALKLAMDDGSMPQITPMEPTPSHIATTRATAPTNAEKIVNNLNFFFVRKGLSIPIRHCYLETADIEIDPETGLFKEILLEKMYIGKYKMYVVANQGKIEPADAAGFTAQEVDTMQLKNNCQSSEELLFNGLPMTCVEDIEIKLVEGEPTPISVILEFAVAKINFYCNIIEALRNTVTLKSVQLRNSASVAGAFNDTKPSDEYDDYTAHDFPPNNTDYEYITSYYVLKNHRGNVDKIGSEEDRTFFNAPKNATYVYLEMEQKSTLAMLSFYLFAGNENEITNFDTKLNTIYNVNVAIKDIDPANDPRVSSLTIVSHEWDQPMPMDVSSENWKKLEFKCYNLNGESFSLISTHEKLPADLMGQANVYDIDLKKSKDGVSLGNGPVKNKGELFVENLFAVPDGASSYTTEFFYYYKPLEKPTGKDKKYDMKINIGKSNGNYIGIVLPITFN